MFGRLTSTLSWLGHKCSGFEVYFMNLQSSPCTTWQSRGCEGRPNIDEARKDYQAMMRPRSSPFGGFS